MSFKGKKFLQILPKDPSSSPGNTEKKVAPKTDYFEGRFGFLISQGFQKYIQLSDSNFSQRLRDFRYKKLFRCAKFESEYCI